MGRFEKKEIKVRELIRQDIDIDVFDDYTEEVGICFCGPIRLTTEGKEHFKEVLDYKVVVYIDNALDTKEAVIQINEYDDADDRVDKSVEFFNAMAGYCSDSDYKKWVEED